MIEDKYEALISKLVEATINGQLAWEKTSASNEFQVKLGNNAVSISYYDPNIYGYIPAPSVNIQKPTVSIIIINSDGKEVDGETREKGDAGYDKLYNLYKDARRKCLNVDETLDEILKNL